MNAQAQLAKINKQIAQLEAAAAVMRAQQAAKSKKTRRTYEVADKLAVVARVAAGESVSAVSKATGINDTQIYDWTNKAFGALEDKRRKSA